MQREEIGEAVLRQIWVSILFKQNNFLRKMTFENEHMANWSHIKRLVWFIVITCSCVVLLILIDFIEIFFCSFMSTKILVLIVLAIYDKNNKKNDYFHRHRSESSIFIEPISEGIIINPILYIFLLILFILFILFYFSP